MSVTWATQESGTNTFSFSKIDIRESRVVLLQLDANNVY